MSDIYYTYTNDTGQEITVYITKDCGQMNGYDGSKWHKVICRPIGVNVSCAMILDKNKLVQQ